MLVEDQNRMKWKLLICNKKWSPNAARVCSKYEQEVYKLYETIDTSWNIVQFHRNFF